jgi:hypothetical protein
LSMRTMARRSGAICARVPSMLPDTNSASNRSPQDRLSAQEVSTMGPHGLIINEASIQGVIAAKTRHL